MQYAASVFDTHPSFAGQPSPMRFTFSICRHSNRCTELIARREHLLVGISPFNSRFSTDYVSSLLAWASAEFRRVDVLLPDEESAALLLVASGVPLTKARRKARKELRRHRRALGHILDARGDAASHIRIVAFSDYFLDERYVKLRLAAQNAFETCPEFRDACLDMSRQALERRTHTTGTPCMMLAADADVRLASSYVIAEIPFYLCSAELLGTDCSVLAYHRPWPIGDALLSGELPLSVDGRQGHGIVSIAATISRTAHAS
jgi:cyclo(L-leucyl-L-leucyl) synthase